MKAEFLRLFSDRADGGQTEVFLLSGDITLQTADRQTNTQARQTHKPDRQTKHKTDR